MQVGAPNKLTFFCELYSDELVLLFSNPDLINQLKTLNATISLGIVDFSDERARIVRLLNNNNIPVIAWQLLSKEQGYWYNMTNASQAISGYEEFLEWTEHHNLFWEGLGVDIEPDISEFQCLLSDKLRFIPILFKRMFKKKYFDDACKIYHTLVSKMKNDGYSVDSYEFLFMEDDRKAGSCLFGRLLGVTDVPANRRVLMLYSSFFRPYGAAVLCNYACGADSVAVGSTGGGVELDGMDHPPLNWDEFSRDLRLARSACDDIHIFSLEGCVEQDFISALIDFNWESPVKKPQLLSSFFSIARFVSFPILWLTTHPFFTGLALGGGLTYFIFLH
ncbi:MAG: hypothetical protein OQL19_20325 [Gammaproteobacteria bacterium]|nr:hypothetical protein [Gammaproteobacteria bacterium]